MNFVQIWQKMMDSSQSQIWSHVSIHLNTSILATMQLLSVQQNLLLLHYTFYKPN